VTTARGRRITGCTIADVRRAIAGIGRTLVTLGLLILLFVVYQLWGTGIFTARAQENLKHDFQSKIQQEENDTVGPVPTTVKKPTGPTTPTTVFSHRLAPLDTPPNGEVEGAISIPSVGINYWYVEGTSRDDLKKGPGHYEGTPLPGTFGNAAIAGHRTTYLHPFGDLDKVKVGDDIIITTLAGTVFDYKMYKQLIVLPSDVWVVANTPLPELTLTACTPKGSASHRIVIKARLAPAKSAKVTQYKPKPKVTRTGTGKARTADAALAEGLSGQTRSLVPSVVWGIIAAVMGLAWWWTFRRWRHPLTWLIGVVPFVIVLFPFYVYLERALPAGY
jgi:sortase A